MDGQGAQILQQVEQLLAQLAQQETEPTVQRAIASILQSLDPLMQIVGRNDQQDMTSGLNNPTEGATPMPGDASMTGGAMGAGDIEDLSDGGADEATEQGAPPATFGGAKKAAMANFREKGSFSKSGSKGEKPQTNKTKNRLKQAGRK